MATQSIIERQPSSGEVTYEGKLIKWHKPDTSILSINLDQVAVIGEYRTDSGPFADDWFLVFVFKSGAWKEISVYAEGFQDLAHYLSQLFSIDFSRYFLASSAGCKSFIRYPDNLEGKELFVLIPPKGYEPARTFLQDMKLALGLGVYGKNWKMDLTEEVKARVSKTSG